MTTKKINELIKESNVSREHISDGFHTFGELYKCRHRLYIELCKQLCQSNEYDVWVSLKHSDNTMFDKMFILGVVLPDGKQISFHLPIGYYPECEKYFEVREFAPEWDGHTLEDVLERLQTL